MRTFFIVCGIMKFVVASETEAKLRACFVNSKDAKIIGWILEEMSHRQPPTPIQCDNKTAAGIAHDTMKNNIIHGQWKYISLGHRSGKQVFFGMQWHPGQKNLGGYF